MHTRTIGQTTVSAIGLGGMPLSIEGRPDDRAAAIATIHASLDAGVRLIDTADAYHLAGHVDDEEVGHNESLIAEALRSWSGDTDDVLVATKGGHTRSLPDSWEQDGSPEHLRAACEASLRRLGVDAIGLYQYHRPDPAVPYEDSVGTLRDLLDEGKIRQAGISNANPEQIRQAQDILGEAGSRPCRTSTRPRSCRPARSSSCAPSSASRSCRGHRWVGSRRRPISGPPTRCSSRWPTSSTPARSR